MSKVLMPIEATRDMLSYCDESQWIDLVRIAGEKNDLDRLVEIEHEAAFLLDRLSELTLDGETYDLVRYWEGHVEPSISRLRSLIRGK